LGRIPWDLVVDFSDSLEEGMYTHLAPSIETVRPVDTIVEFEDDTIKQGADKCYWILASHHCQSYLNKLLESFLRRKYLLFLKAALAKGAMNPSLSVVVFNLILSNKRLNLLTDFNQHVMNLCEKWEITGKTIIGT
jgi:hypothetical protein